MKKILIELEVDNNVTLEEMESIVQKMIDDYINTTEAFYTIGEEEIKE